MRRIVAVQVGEFLNDLGYAPVAVHVAETADVHKNVEAELGAGVEDSEKFIMAASMTEPQVDDFVDPRIRPSGDQVTKLAVAVVTDGVEEGGGELDFEGFGALD